MTELRTIDEARAMTSTERIAQICTYRQRVIAWDEIERHIKQDGEAPTEEEKKVKVSDNELRDAVRLLQADRFGRAQTKGKTTAKVVEPANLDDF